MLTKRGRSRAVLISEEAFAALQELRRSQARIELQERLLEVRRLVTDSGLDPAVVDEAVAAARRAR